MQLIRSPERKHPDWDVPEFVPAAGLAAAARAFAKIIEVRNERPNHPIRKRPRGTLAAAASAAGIKRKRSTEMAAPGTCTVLRRGRLAAVSRPALFEGRSR